MQEGQTGESAQDGTAQAGTDEKTTKRSRKVKRKNREPSAPRKPRKTLGWYFVRTVSDLGTYGDLDKLDPSTIVDDDWSDPVALKGTNLKACLSEVKAHLEALKLDTGYMFIRVFEDKYITRAAVQLQRKVAL